MADPFSSQFAGLGSPARKGFAIALADTVLTTIPQAIYVGTGGDITLRLVDDAGDIVLKNVPTGALLPIRPQIVRLTGTTASNIVGFD